MPDVSQHTPGTFCWAELATTDSDAAKKFYTELFGWTSHDDPVGEGMVYTMLQLRGKNSAALYQMNEEMRSMGVPPHWLSYVTVENADAVADAAESHGATVLKEAFDVFDIGRMAVIRDPQGATFALWQPKKEIGAQVTDEPGALCWNELATRDTDSAGTFYKKVFDWSAEVQDMGTGPYTIFKIGEAQAGGMLKLDEKWREIPPHWMVYFSVDDCAASAKKAADLGAQALVEPTEVPNVGTFAVLQDPQGAAFSVMSFTEKSS